MKAILKNLGNLTRDANGASAMEYGFLAALIATAFIVGAAVMGTSVSNLTQSSADQIDNVIATMTGAPAAASNGAADGKNSDHHGND